MLLRTVRNKHLWLMVSLMVYTFAISGGVYDIIRNPQAFVYRQDRSIVWFHPQACIVNCSVVYHGVVQCIVLYCSVQYCSVV